MDIPTLIQRISADRTCHRTVFRLLQEDGLKHASRQTGVQFNLNDASPECLSKITAFLDGQDRSELDYIDDTETKDRQKTQLDPLQEKLRKRMRELHRRMSRHKKSVAPRDDGYIDPYINDEGGHDGDVGDAIDVEPLEEDQESDEGDDVEADDDDAEADGDFDDPDLEEEKVIDVEDETDSEPDVITDYGDAAEEPTEKEDETEDPHNGLTTVADFSCDHETTDTKCFTLSSVHKEKSMKELLWFYKTKLTNVYLGTDQEFEDFAQHVG